MAIHRIRRFDPFQTAKIMGVMYGLLGLIFTPIFLLVALYSPAEPGFGMGFAIAIPLVYAVIGFVGSLIGAAVYNAVAGWVGGLEVELE